MKTALKISLLLNLGLLGWLIVSQVHQVKPVVEPGHDPAAPTQSPATVMTSPPSNQSPAKPSPFRWDQLYARDYHVYVKNLRAIGCPEPTLRAIVAADVHAVVQPEATELEKKLSELANSSWVDQIGSRTNVEAWKADLLHLPDEEAAMLADCLGETTDTASPVPAPCKHSLPMADANALMAAPLIAQPVNLAVLNLDPGQVQAITDLQKIFLQKIGGPNQDPSDPAYQARWRTAREEVDNMMKGLIGDQAFLDYQQQAFANAQAQSAHSVQPANSSTVPSATAN